MTKPEPMTYLTAVVHCDNCDKTNIIYENATAVRETHVKVSQYVEMLIAKSAPPTNLKPKRRVTCKDCGFYVEYFEK